MVAFLGEFCVKSISFRICLAFFVALIFNFSPVTHATSEDNKLLEDFSAELNNNTNWNNSYAVNGLRFCSVSENRFWVDTSNEDCNGDIGAEPLGSMSIDNESGTLIMDAELGRTFPYIWSKDINLTSSNDFLLEFRMKYNSIGPHGTGLVFRTWNDPSPMESNEPFVSKSSFNDTVYFAIWSDFPENSSTPAAIVANFQDKTIRISNSPYDFHTFKLESRNDEYRLWIDNELVASEIIETVNGSPFYIWIGNPLISNVSNRWSSMEIDYIRLAPLDSNKVQSGLQYIFPFLTTNS